MSFILDALKKSETDRQRQSGPSLFEVKIAPPRRALPVWAIAIALLLGINVVVISWMLLRHSATQQPAAASTTPAAAPVPAPAITSATGAAAHSSTAAAGTAVRGLTAGVDKAASTAPSAAARTPDRDQSPATPPAPVPALGQGQSRGADPDAGQAPGHDPNDYAPAVPPAKGTVGTAEAAGAAGDLPLYQQIVSSSGLPALHLDLHVFANRPQDRFVMINMHRLGEGGSLPSGVHVDAIRPDGVVLSYRGTRFLLPRD
ncbi:MAG: general secretion pathway protein GspB [Steroidobacteraceae bacterium]